MRSLATAIALLTIRRSRRRNRMLGIAIGYWMLRKIWGSAEYVRPPFWARAGAFMLLGPGALDRH